MESKPISDLLDTVKDLIAATHTAVNDDFPVLPAEIPELPRHAQTLPESTLPLSRALERVTQNVLPYLNRSSLSSRYYGFVTGGVTPAALVGDVLATIYDQNCAIHLPNETISTNVEVAALNMLVDLLQLPDDWLVGTGGSACGTFTTGATASNVLGMITGREYVLSEAAWRATGKRMSAADDGVVAVGRAGGIETVQVLSTMAHSSIKKAAAIAGIGRNNVVDIAKPGTATVIDMEKLQQLLETAQSEKKAYILSISAGEVNTGYNATESADMMRRIRELCNKHGVWIHVDGAFGIFARVLLGHPKESEYSAITDGMRGLELADSITADGHKLLNVPYDCGLFFSRHKEASETCFTNGGAAYFSSGVVSNVQSPSNIGLENSRRFRALPAYTALSAYGREGYTDMIIRQITFSRKIAGWLYEHQKYELLSTEKSRDDILSKIFMIVIFKAKDEQKNEELAQRIKDSRQMYVSGTVFEGVTATRLAVSNWRVDVEADFEAVAQVLDSVV